MTSKVVALSPARCGRHVSFHHLPPALPVRLCGPCRPYAGAREVEAIRVMAVQTSTSWVQAAAWAGAAALTVYAAYQIKEGLAAVRAISNDLRETVHDVRETVALVAAIERSDNVGGRVPHP